MSLFLKACAPQDAATEAASDARPLPYTEHDGSIDSVSERTNRETGDTASLDASETPVDAEVCGFPMPNSASQSLPRPAHYEVRGDTVVDRVTGLMWQRIDSGSVTSQSGAFAYCDSLALAGHVDWRVPHRLELISLIDVDRVNPAIDVEAFPDTPSQFVWSASDVAGQPEAAWYVGYAYGFAYAYDRKTAARVRCVRDSATPTCVKQRFVRDKNDVVHDATTLLAWQSQAAAQALPWLEAISHCDRQGGGWRLPSMKELQTLLDEDRTLGPRFFANAFPNLPGGFYWSSTAMKGVEDHAWYVNFLFGTPDYDGMLERNLVLCVR